MYVPLVRVDSNKVVVDGQTIVSPTAICLAVVSFFLLQTCKEEAARDAYLAQFAGTEEVVYSDFEG